MIEHGLLALIGVPLAGAAAAAAAGRGRADLARWVALATAVLTLLIGLRLAAVAAAAASVSAGPALEMRLPWVPRYGIELHLALDGLSSLFVLLTAVLGCVAVLASWREVQRAVGAHYACILATVAGIMGVFLAYDLFLFYFFWELMLVPMYFLIGVWGHERRVAAAIKFFLFTMVSGLLLLIAILGLYFAHAAATGEYTFDYLRLLGTPVATTTARWLFLGFVAAFAVKLPLFPVHSWLPDAHTEAPTAGSILLAGLLLKTGGYGLLRFAVPLFPAAAAELAYPMALLGVAGIVYGAVLAFGQRDMKRLIAYSSVSHMGFVVLGIATWRLASVQGAALQMLAHGLATGALFGIAGMVHERLHSKEFADLGGLWSSMPRLGAFTMLFVLAAVGLPGSGNFVGEFMVLIGSFPARPGLVGVAVVGIVVGTVALLALMQRGFFGPPNPHPQGEAPADLRPREGLMLAALAVLVIGLGVAPMPMLGVAQPALEALVAPERPFDPADPPNVEAGTPIVAFQEHVP